MTTHRGDQLGGRRFVRTETRKEAPPKPGKGADVYEWVPGNTTANALEYRTTRKGPVKGGAKGKVESDRHARKKRYNTVA